MTNSLSSIEKEVNCRCIAKVSLVINGPLEVPGSHMGRTQSDNPPYRSLVGIRKQQMLQPGMLDQDTIEQRLVARLGSKSGPTCPRAPYLACISVVVG